MRKLHEQGEAMHIQCYGNDFHFSNEGHVTKQHEPLFKWRASHQSWDSPLTSRPHRLLLTHPTARSSCRKLAEWNHWFVSLNPEKFKTWRCVLYWDFFCQSSSVFIRLCCGCDVGRTGPSWGKRTKKKERGRKHGSMMRELLGLKWVSPPLLAAPAFDWYPQIHVEFRFALLLFGGRVIADNQLRLLFLTGSHLSTIPSSRVTHRGLQPLDPSFYRCEHAEWLLMFLSCDHSSEICPFTANHS